MDSTMAIADFFFGLSGFIYAVKTTSQVFALKKKSRS